MLILLFQLPAACRGRNGQCRIEDWALVGKGWLVWGRGVGRFFLGRRVICLELDVNHEMYIGEKV